MLPRCRAVCPASRARVWCVASVSGCSFWSVVSCGVVLCNLTGDARRMLVWPFRLARSVGYLVDPASSRMLVSKIKPCMCKYKLLNSKTANGSLNQL